MGLSIAGVENLGNNIAYITKITTTFFLCITIANIAVLPFVDRYLPLHSQRSDKVIPFITMVKESVQLLFLVGFGVFIGLILPLDLSWVESASELILYALLFLIGIQLRNSGLTLRQILLNKQGVVIALLVIVSSWIGGVVAALIIDIPLQHGLAMASGFGWYSLAGILIGDALGPIFGGASFMVELLRELVALIMIPILIKRIPCTAVGYAGATAMDFTLPIIQSTGGVKCVPVAIVSGFILSIFVPIFMLFFVSV
jgi:uncharacterized membrane protein YbjE (DUF340 family)